MDLYLLQDPDSGEGIFDMPASGEAPKLTRPGIMPEIIEEGEKMSDDKFEMLKKEMDQLYAKLKSDNREIEKSGRDLGRKQIEDEKVTKVIEVLEARKGKMEKERDSKMKQAALEISENVEKKTKEQADTIEQFGKIQAELESYSDNGRLSEGDKIYYEYVADRFDGYKESAKLKSDKLEDDLRKSELSKVYVDVPSADLWTAKIEELAGMFYNGLSEILEVWKKATIQLSDTQSSLSEYEESFMVELSAIKSDIKDARVAGDTKLADKLVREYEEMTSNHEKQMFAFKLSIDGLRSEVGYSEEKFERLKKDMTVICLWMRDNLGKEFGYDSYDAIYKTISESFSSEDIQNAMQAIAEAKDDLSQFEEAHVAHKSEFDKEFANSMLSLGTTAGDIKYWAAYIDAEWVSEQEAQNKKDLADISKKLDDAKVRGAAMKEEISEITENLDAAKAELEQLEEESEAWSEKSDEISTLEVEFKAAVKGFSSHEIQLNEVANTKADMEKSNDDFSNKVEKAANAHPAAVAKYTEVKDMLLNSQEEHASWLVQQNTERSEQLDEIKALEAKAGSSDSFRSKVNIEEGEIDAELSIEAKEEEKKMKFSESAVASSVQLEHILKQAKAS